MQIKMTDDNLIPISVGEIVKICDKLHVLYPDMKGDAGKVITVFPESQSADVFFFRSGRMLRSLKLVYLTIVRSSDYDFAVPVNIQKIYSFPIVGRALEIPLTEIEPQTSLQSNAQALPVLELPSATEFRTASLATELPQTIVEPQTIYNKYSCTVKDSIEAQHRKLDADFKVLNAFFDAFTGNKFEEMSEDLIKGVTRIIDNDDQFVDLIMQMNRIDRLKLGLIIPDIECISWYDLDPVVSDIINSPWCGSIFGHMFGIPARLMGDNSNKTYKDVNSQNNQYLQYCLLKGDKYLGDTILLKNLDMKIANELLAACDFKLLR